jgi:hypothetical protein
VLCGVFGCRETAFSCGFHCAPSWFVVVVVVFFLFFFLWFFWIRYLQSSLAQARRLTSFLCWPQMLAPALGHFAATLTSCWPAFLAQPCCGRQVGFSFFLLCISQMTATDNGELGLQNVIAITPASNLGGATFNAKCAEERARQQIILPGLQAAAELANAAKVRKHLFLLANQLNHLIGGRDRGSSGRMGGAGFATGSEPCERRFEQVANYGLFWVFFSSSDCVVCVCVLA